ncbi:MAG: UbiD family decarboxylase, partial [Candidatus Binatia bacterium]|nr:UbiD family decarboxylase [Candidatus Binatia bacterium]
MAKNLQDFLQRLEIQLPHDFLQVGRTASPADFEVTALLQHLEDDRKFPALLFEKPRNLKGELSPFPLLSNLFASRRRCALALGMDPGDERLPLSLEYARREGLLIPPITIPVREAPVKEVVKRGRDADLYDFPVVRHHAMDPAPYIDMTPV